jgi:hypothetical protein
MTTNTNSIYAAFSRRQAICCPGWRGTAAIPAWQVTALDRASRLMSPTECDGLGSRSPGTQIA